ncbi:hypothetical protein ACFLY2_00425 [Patescibacteria group bacterium]
MKKIIALLAMSILLVSCGSTEEVENNIETPVVETPIVEEIVSEEEVLSEDEINEAMDELFNSLED